MTADKEIVLKNFGNASETEFRFHYVMQLFLSLEDDRTHDPYTIDEEHVLTLIANPGRIPDGLKTFITWQRNIMKLDDEEISNIQMPRGLKNKYDVKGARLSCEIEQQKRIDAVKACIDEIDAYMKKFFEIVAILEATEDRFHTVEDYVFRVEAMNSDHTAILAEAKNNIEDFRMQLTALHAALEDDILPDLIKFDSIVQNARTLLIALSATNLKIRESIRKYEIGQRK